MFKLCSYNHIPLNVGIWLFGISNKTLNGQLRGLSERMQETAWAIVD